VDRHAAVYRDSGPWGEHGGVGYGGTYGDVPPMAQAPVALPAPPPLAKPACANCGVIEAVTAVDKPGEGTGLGMAGGALGGAVVGKQFGKGHGQDLLTVLGAVGGAFAGHQVEKSVRTTRSYEVRVRMEDGSVRSITQSTPPAWRNGDRVKVDGGSINASYS
jgi:outer membrane lipoprotein SlyB